MDEEPGTTRMPPPARPDESDTTPEAETSHEGSPSAPVLVVTRGRQTGQQITLNRSPVQLGRSATCHVVLDDVTVSRQHAEITKKGEQYVVTDVGSLNGTYLNRSPVDSAVVNDGDEIQIGIFRLVFRA